MSIPGTYGYPNLGAHPANPSSGFILYFFGGQLYSLGVSPATPVPFAVTAESIQDVVGALFQDTATVDVDYQDGANILQLNVLPGGINHQLLNGAGSNTHAQIDSHIASSANPHNVTPVQQLLTGLSLADSSDVLSTDNLLVAIGKLQAQLNAFPAPNVFGSEFEDFGSATQINFSGGIAQRRQYTTASKPAGRYRVAVLIQTEPSSTGSNDDWELRINGTIIGLKFENEAKDTGGDIRNLIYIEGYYQHASAGTFNIQIWGGTQGGTAELNGDVAEVWRVS